MKVSIIVPVYNVEKYIDKCLNSLVNQTLNDIEIIVVNDGSPDNSQKIIDKYAKKYPKKIKSFIKENGGLSSARNYGLENCTGEYIGFIDSDDWLELDAIEKMYNEALKTSSDIVICDMVDHYDDGSSLYHNCTKFNSVYEVTPSACNKLFKKSIISKDRFMPGIWYEDLNFTTKLFLRNPKISTINKGFYHCIVRKGSIMHNVNSLKNLDMITVIDDLKEYALKNKLYDENLFNFLIFHHILVTSINRVANQKSKDKKYVIKQFRNYCLKNISNYKNMPFYKTISKNRKIIARLNYMGFYNISKIILFINSKIKGN